MQPLASLAGLRKTVRIFGFLLVAVAPAAPLAFAGVNRWTTGGPSGVTVTSLAIDATNPDTVYAGTGLQLFKSSDGGLSWTASLTLSGTGSFFQSGLAIDPLTSSNVYAATIVGLYKSSNGGDSWSAVGPNGPISPFLLRLTQQARRRFSGGRAAACSRVTTGVTLGMGATWRLGSTN